MVLGVENLMLDTFVRQIGRQEFVVLDGNRADENRLAFFVQLPYFSGYCLHLAGLGLKDLVVMVQTLYRFVGRNDESLEPVDFVEFFLGGGGCAGHAGELLVHSEIILEGDGGEGARFFFDAHPFFGLYGLMQAFRPAAAWL